MYVTHLQFHFDVNMNVGLIKRMKGLTINIPLCVYVISILTIKIIIKLYHSKHDLTLVWGWGNSLESLLRGYLFSSVTVPKLYNHPRGKLPSILPSVPIYPP